MTRKIVFTIGLSLSFFILFLASCRRINQSTELGNDLIPPIDNINTFDTTLIALAFNDSIRFADDSIRMGEGGEHFLGLINNDPFFGRTDARIFAQIKPSGFGLYPFARRDSVKIDSLVLVLDYIETWGDSNVPQAVRVYEITSSHFSDDTIYLIREEPVAYSQILSENSAGQVIFPRDLNDSVKAFRDTSVNQLRLRLDTNLARRFFNYDTINAYKSDSLFNVNFRGFAIRSENNGNAIMGFNLQGANTKLAFYYRHPKGNGTGDTAKVTYFTFTPVSASANYIKRDYSGFPFAMSVGGSLPDPFIFIQKTPGTFATIKIPGLGNLSNRVVHRAELIFEQAYHPLDAVFTAPEALFLDAFDTSLNAFRTIPYDFGFGVTGPNFLSFGSIGKSATDPFGNPIKVWKFNISRYVQHIFTKQLPVFDLRLTAPFFPYYNKEAYFGHPPTLFDPRTANFDFPVNPTIAKGRVRLFGNNGPGDINSQRLRLRIIYSKL